MRREQYEIVHVYTPIASVLGRVAAKLSEIPHVIYIAYGFPFHDRSPWLEYWLYFLIEKGCATFTDLILTQNLEDVETAIRRLCHPDKVRYLGNRIDSDRFDPDAIGPATKAALR